ncbi:uncharacterized protein [Macaca fascicularis]|uniref:uncharacterized protein n=1 Tax=Macaca fascicularis TaxID=9541 RepID=UPI0032B08896
MRGGAGAASPPHRRPPLPGRPAAPSPPPAPARRLHKRRRRGVRSPRPPEPPRPRAALTSAAAAPRLVLRTRAPGSGRSPEQGGVLPRRLCAAARRGRSLARPGAPAADLAAWQPLPPPPRPPQRLSPSARPPAAPPPPRPRPPAGARARRGAGPAQRRRTCARSRVPVCGRQPGLWRLASRPPAADGRWAGEAGARPELRDRSWAAPERGAGARDRPGVAAPPARAPLRRPCPPSCPPLGARLLRFGDGVSVSPRLERGGPILAHCSLGLPSSRDPAASASLVAGTAGAPRPAIGVCVLRRWRLAVLPRLPAPGPTRSSLQRAPPRQAPAEPPLLPPLPELSGTRGARPALGQGWGPAGVAAVPLAPSPRLSSSL